MLALTKILMCILKNYILTFQLTRTRRFRSTNTFCLVYVCKTDTTVPTVLTAIAKTWQKANKTMSYWCHLKATTHFNDSAKTLSHVLVCLRYANSSIDPFIVSMFFRIFSRSNIFTLKLVCASRFLSQFFLRLVRHVQKCLSKYTLNIFKISSRILCWYFVDLFYSLYYKINIYILLIAIEFL